MQGVADGCQAGGTDRRECSSCAKLDSPVSQGHIMNDRARERSSAIPVTGVGSDDLSSYSSHSSYTGHKTAEEPTAAVLSAVYPSDALRAYQRVFPLQMLYMQDEDMTKEGDERETVLVLRGRLSGTQRRRLAGLLDSEYTPDELAREIGFSPRQINRVYIPDGCPHRRDQDGEVLINGKAFRDWALERYKKIHLSPSQAFCRTCRRPVEIIDPVAREKNRLRFIESDCPHCGRRVARILGRKKRSEQ
jgi:hypothetical protein